MKLKYVYQDVDRHGNVRVYFRRGKHCIRLRSAPDTAAFAEEYKSAVAASEAPAATQVNDPLKPPVAGTWRWLCTEYFKSAAFKELDAEQTQPARRRVLEGTFDEKVSPTSQRVFADMPLAAMDVDAVEVLRDRKGPEAPEAANSRVKAIRQVFKWAIAKKVGGVKMNPARDVPYLKGSTGGFHTWTVDEVQRFEAAHPIGTKARLAFALYLYTGVRKSDVVLLGAQHIRNGWFKFTTRKGRKRNPITVEIPVLPELQQVIEATSCIGVRTFLVTDHGKPFTANGFGNRMRKWCDEAGLPECTSHGIRKAAAATAAENGATVKQLMAIFGWLDERQAIYYTREARRKKLAAGATELLGRHRS